MIEKIFLKIWYSSNIFYLFISLILLPLSFIYLIVVYINRNLTKQKKFQVPILCVGNINIGGTGKTSTLLSLLPKLIKNRPNLVVLLRGYKGRIKSLYKVNTEIDSSVDVGDEALMYANIVTTYISSKRIDAIENIIKLESPDIIILDDGFQDASIEKDKNLVLINGDRGFGNNFILPSGPLREIPSSALRKSDILIFIGEDKNGIYKKYKHLIKGNQMFNGKIVANLKGSDKKYFAFSGIGNNESFFKTLKNNNFIVTKKMTFPDHYQYSNEEVENIIKIANQEDLTPITTEKDINRITPELRNKIECLKIKIEFEKQEELINEMLNL